MELVQPVTIAAMIELVDNPSPKTITVYDNHLGPLCLGSFDEAAGHQYGILTADLGYDSELSSLANSNDGQIVAKSGYVASQDLGQV